jgi:hypothetical protein
MIRILAASLVAAFAIGSVPGASAAPAGGLHRGGGGHVATPGLTRNFGAFHGGRSHNAFRDNAFRGFPWYGVGSYDTPPADVSVTNNQFVAPPTTYRRVCRTEALVVPAEAGGEREVRVTRCFLE